MRVAVLALLAGAFWQASGPEALFREAITAQQRGDDEAAAAKYRELVKLRPDVLEVRANFGATLARLGRFDEAIEQYRAAMAISPDNPALRFNLGLAYYKKGDLAAAADQFSGLTSAPPGDVRVATLLADCYARLGRNDRVITLLTPVEAAHADDLGIAWLLGSALIRSGNPKAGLERVEKVARRGRRAEAFLLAGQTALRLNEFERARDLAGAALRLDPRLPGLLTLHGTALQYLGDNAGAIASLRKALEANPDDFDAHLTLGAVLNTERDLEGARLHVERALQLNPPSTLARYVRGRVARTQGQLEVALKDFELVVREDPGWAQPHLDLANLYYRLNRPEDGKRERAVFDRLTAEQPKPGTASRAPSALPSR